jgi:hypothetical protein
MRALALPAAVATISLAGTWVHVRTINRPVDRAVVPALTVFPNDSWRARLHEQKVEEGGGRKGRSRVVESGGGAHKAAASYAEDVLGRCIYFESPRSEKSACAPRCTNNNNVPYCATPGRPAVSVDGAVVFSPSVVTAFALGLVSWTTFRLKSRSPKLRGTASESGDEGENMSQSPRGNTTR